MESVSEKTKRASTEEPSTNTNVDEKVCVETSKTENEESTENTQENAEKLQNGSVHLDEVEEAKKNVVEENIQNAVLGEDSGSQEDGKDIGTVAPQMVVEPSLTKEEEDTLTNESVAESGQELTPETENTTADTTEAISKETDVKEEKESNISLQENKASTERPTEGIQVVTELQEDEKSEESDLKESGVQENEVTASTPESNTKSTDDSANQVQEEMKAGDTSSVQDTDSARETLITDKELRSAQEATEDITVNAPEKVTSEPTLVQNEGKVTDSVQIIDSVQTDNEEGKANITEETEIRILERQEDMDQKLVDSNKDNQEAKRSEESNTEQTDQHSNPSHKLASTADEEKKRNSNIGPDHLVVSHDLPVKNKPDGTTVKQPDEHELSPIPNISISCTENETENKLNNQNNVESNRHLDRQSAKDNDTDSGTGSTADNSSIDLNLSISSFLTKNKESGSISLQVRVHLKL